MGNAKLCCGVCCAIAVFVSCVMVIVSVTVIAPKVAQHTLDNTVLSLTNASMAACPTPYSYMWNHAKITVPSLPIPAASTILPYNQTVYTTGCMVKGRLTPGFCCGEKWTQPCMDMGGFGENAGIEEEFFMGWYNSPEMTVSAGDNHKDFNVILNDNMTIVINAWVVPLFLVRVPGKLILKAADVSVKVDGLTIQGRTMHNEVTCFAVENPLYARNVDLPAEVCYPDDLSKGPYTTQEYTLVCDSGDHIPTTTTSTTTAPPPTPAPPAPAPTPAPPAFIL